MHGAEMRCDQSLFVICVQVQNLYSTVTPVSPAGCGPAVLPELPIHRNDRVNGKGVVYIPAPIQDSFLDHPHLGPLS